MRSLIPNRLLTALLCWCAVISHAAFASLPACNFNASDTVATLNFRPHFPQTYLNPDSGRFWTRDTFEGRQCDPHSLHKYLYANANPVAYTDPSGLMSLVETMRSSYESVRVGIRTSMKNLRRYGRVAICAALHVSYKVAQSYGSLPPRCYGNAFVLTTSGTSFEYIAKTGVLTAELVARQAYMRMRCDYYWSAFKLAQSPLADLLGGHNERIRQLVIQIGRCGADAATLRAVGR